MHLKQWLTFCVLLLLAGQAGAHGLPLQVTFGPTDLSLNTLAYGDRLNGLKLLSSSLSPDGQRLETTVPGIDPVNAGSGDQLAFETRGHLFFWQPNGANTGALASTSQVLTILRRHPANDPTNPAIDVGPSSGPQTGFNFVPQVAGTPTHHLLRFFLEDQTAPAGVYGLGIRFTSPGRTPSPWMTLAFNYDPTIDPVNNPFGTLTDAGLNQALADLSLALVPEPSAFGLATFGLATLAWLRRRGRRRN